jgi:hypothetical protein
MYSTVFISFSTITFKLSTYKKTIRLLGKCIQHPLKDFNNPQQRNLLVKIVENRTITVIKRI